MTAFAGSSTPSAKAIANRSGVEAGIPLGGGIIGGIRLLTLTRRDRAEHRPQPSGQKPVEHATASVLRKPVYDRDLSPRRLTCYVATIPASNI